MDGAPVRLANTGTRRGREVVQVYASRPDSAIERPPRWLAGFAVVEADAGEEVIVDVPLAPRAFQHWDGGWETEPGAFTLEAGRSVADLAWRADRDRRRRRTLMELRQLEYFAAVARHRHFTRAAEALYVTQPALSQQVRRLEAELGLALLRRTSKGVELTAAGADLLVHAEKVLAEVAAARADMDRHTGVSRGVVRVASTAADAPRLPEALADFHGDHPGIQIALRQGSAAEVVALVQAGTVDVAVLALHGGAAPASRPPARRGAAAGRGRRSTTSWRARRSRSTRCAGAPFILAEPGTALRETVMAATQAAGFSPLPLFEVGDPATVRFLVRAGLGIASCRRAGSSGRGRWSARRISRSPAPPAVAAHARGGCVTGRPAAARAPARALTRGACAGARRRASARARRS